ncbi:hypothetical protein Q7C_258 [Methylophaga frappieri]|uniref:Protochlamydia outer membrane protein domain-containing protein n=2 Tax=Methylophaga frappieri (strain ATCC BAA-2434 / DSM 25690 / JAM7) TaxID=754477 RepID=I1YEU4_METFJ|nr:hypothetical protein Q7C_258 [Methylophaga frappieri]
MHVFEAESTTSPAPIANPDHNAQIPAKVIPDLPVGQAKQPETLKVHVYDRRPEKKPIFAYDKADVYFKAGYRRDDLVWSIAGPGGRPNILSELTWKDIEIATLNLGATLQMRNNWFVTGDAVWGEIVNGENQDSDYFENNRREEFSRSNNGADEGNVLDFSVGFGYRYQWLFNEAGTAGFELRPKLGVAYHSQDLKIVDGRQTILNSEPVSIRFPGLRSSYDTSWFGPWVGLESVFFQTGKFSLGLNVEYHYIDYDATAEWNLRSDFAQPESFEHEADGYGWVTELRSQWHFTPDLALTLDLQFQKWLADRRGKDTTYLVDGTELTTKFNEVEWDSYGVSLGLNYVF